MPHIEWTSDLETGNEKVDGQHKQIFELLDLLSNSVKEKKTKKAIKEVIEKLTLHVLEHFRDEEEFMNESAYSSLHEHKISHEKIFDQALELIEKYRNEELEIATPLVVFLVQLITTHIQKEDKVFFDWLKKTKIP